MPHPFVPDSLRLAPFTLADAAAEGLGPTALRSLPWRQLFHGVWVHSAVPDSRELRLSAVRLVVPPRAVVCGLTAAWLYGADVRRENDLDVHVSFPKGGRIRSQVGLRVCQETLGESDVTTMDGSQITTALRTAFDCARWLHGAERVVVLDALTGARLVTVDEIRDYIAGKRRLRNLRRAEAILDLVDPAAESPQETRLRVLIVEGGLTRPVSQFNVFDPWGGFVARLDLAFPEFKVAVEYDGAWHWEQRRADDRRRDRLRELGWIVLVYSADDLYQRSQEILNEISRHLRARAA